LTVALIVLFCVGTAFGNHGARVLLGSFEGTYSSEFGLGMYICQDGDVVHGYADESFIFRGTADQFDVLTGNFYQAGSGPCSTGTFELDLTTWGVEGFYICQNGKVNTWSAVRQSGFRPTAHQCATLWSDDDTDLEGRFQSDDLLFVDLCFRDPDDDGGDDDDETVQLSYQLNEDGTIIDGFASGFWYANGKIFVGTFYEDFVAGPILMYLNHDGDVRYSWWTGLFQREGRTFLDGNQANNPELHGVGKWNGPRSSSTADLCTRFEVLQTFVLKNLRAIADDDEDYYYFVDEKYIDTSDIEYLRVETASSSSTIILSVVLVTFGLLAVLF
jgi:hypothetical protein